MSDIEIVLGDGTLEHASRIHNADLLEHAAGSLGTFGIVTLLTVERIPAKTHVQLDLDAIEGRYLLAGAADATVAAYDVCATSLDTGCTERCLPVFKVARNNRDCHKYSIASLAWYPR